MRYNPDDIFYVREYTYNISNLITGTHIYWVILITRLESRVAGPGVCLWYVLLTLLIFHVLILDLLILDVLILDVLILGLLILNFVNFRTLSIVNFVDSRP